MLVYATNTALIAHLPALAGDTGIPAAQRALIVPSLAAASLAGKLVYSAIGERVDARAPIWLAAGVSAPTLALLIAFPSFEVMLASAMANGLGTGSLLPAWAALIARCFGAANVASVLGLSRTCAYPLMALSAVFAGWAKDATGSYDLAFQGFLLGALLVALLPLGIRLPQRV
jgi:cyanate permease